MRTSRFSPEQIIQALREAEAGRRVADLCRQLNVAEATFYRWKKQFGEIGVAEHFRPSASRRICLSSAAGAATADERIGVGSDQL